MGMPTPCVRDEPWGHLHASLHRMSPVSPVYYVKCEERADSYQLPIPSAQAER